MKQFNYYDYAPDCNYAMNASGFRNLILLIAAFVMIALSILIFKSHDTLHSIPAGVDEIHSDICGTCNSNIHNVPVHQFKA